MFSDSRAWGSSDSGSQRECIACGQPAASGCYCAVGVVDGYGGRWPVCWRILFDVKDRLVPDRPEIVCICGSTRFVDEMHAANRELTLAGVIVVAPAAFSHAEDQVITNEQKAALDALHRRKIDLADRVLVVNPGGYIGESTSSEVAYARASGKPVSFTDPI